MPTRLLDPAYAPHRTKSAPIASLLAAGLVSAMLLTSPFNARAAAPPARAALAYSHVPAVARGLMPLRDTDPSEVINIDFALKPRNADQIPALLAALADPTSPKYGCYLTPADYRSRFGPTQDQIEAVVAYAKASGLTVTYVSPSGLYVRAAGTAARMNAAFGASLRDYISPLAADNGRIFHAPAQEPTVSAAVAPLLTGIIGLNNAAVPHPALGRAPARTSFSGASPDYAYGTGYADLSPADVANLYSFNTSLKSYSGKNQVLGLLEFDTYTASDISQFEKGYPLTSTFPAVTPVSVDDFSTSTTPGDGQAEVTLDIDMILNLAYNAKQIRVYEASQDDYMADIFDAMANDTTAPSVISVSWGNSEDQISQSDAQTDANVLQQLALQGQTVCVAAGDAGAYTDEDNSSPNADDPAAQQTVVAVGGTDLTDSYNANYTAVTFDSETSWFDSSDTGRGPIGTGGGGGTSKYWPITSWQKGAFSPSVNTQGSTTMRNLPDVSLFGDYDTGGYDIYLSPTGEPASDDGWYGYNGTSAAAPLWAAMLADVNQARIAAGSPVIGMATPQIYTLAESSAYSKDFYDIKDSSTNGYYKAVTGFDNSTGWGTPYNGSQMIADLAAASGAADYTLALSPGTVSAGASVTGTVTILQPAQEAETFTLSSANSTALSVPATATIAEGATSTTFKATAGTVSSTTSVAVTAKLYGLSVSKSVTVNGSIAAPSLSGVSLNPASVTGGSADSTGTVTLSAAAPAGGAVVTLTSSNTSVATVPSSVTVAAGSTSATFTVTSKTVTAAAAVTITAAYSGASKTATLTVNPASGVHLSSVSLSPTSVIGGASTTANRVYLSANATAATTVTISSSNTSLAKITTTPVSIKAGSNSHVFTIQTSTVTSPQTVTITAAANGVTQTATLTVLPSADGLKSVTLSPTSMSGGTTSTASRVYLNGSATQNDAVTVTSSNPSVAQITTNPVTIKTGSSSHVFTITTSKVATSTSVTITATANGTTQSATLTVTP